MRVAGLRLGAGAMLYILLEDAAAVGLLAGATAFAHFGRPPHPIGSPLGIVQATGILGILTASFFWAGLYDFRHLLARATFWRRIACGLFLFACGAGILFGLLERSAVAYSSFLLSFAATAVLGRAAYECFTRTGHFRHRLLFLGIGRAAKRTARELLDHRNRDNDVVGFLGETEEDKGWRIGGRPVLGTYADLERVAEECRVDRVVVAVEDRRRQLPLDALLKLRIRGIEISEEARVHEEIAGKIPVEDLRPSWLIFSDGFTNTPFRNASKRAFDLLAAAAGILLGAPLAALAALAIRLDSKGPILYRQRRVGKGGREFTLYKFRSMRTDAESGARPQWAQENDPRTTRVGRILRKTRIDELPQLLCVLKGTMSFVGPRPERPYFVEQLRKKIPFYDQRHAIKPGLTGWAQVRFRYGADEADATEKLRHDMFYIKHGSLLLDLRILLETVLVVLKGEKGR